MVEEITNFHELGSAMHQLIAVLYPICRSITGNGVRKSLDILSRHIPMNIREVPSGTPVFDWTVPREWNIRDAFIKNPRGEKIVDFQQSNLHVASYSVPVHKTMTLNELRPHLHTLPDHPDWIPYRTLYYSNDWGFCLRHGTVTELIDGEYEVSIDSTLENGSLTYGEYYVSGQTTDEILLSCHCCHPSLCNDNLSGMAVTTFIAKHLGTRRPRYSYRFLFIPGTIGSITWLALNEGQIGRIKHGLVVSGVGDPGILTYKKSRRGDSEIDRAAQHVLSHSGQPFGVQDFSPYGYDERQYCSPGFDLPVGSLTRTPYGTYPEYHTSADNLNLVQADKLADSLQKYQAILEVLENNHRYVSTNPKCEPQLGRRGLYRNYGGKEVQKAREMAMLWVLNMSDGNNDLLSIAERSNLEFTLVHAAAQALADNGLLRIEAA